tara:strand:- start:939 stop:1538 length:600 start_codon:yes stop_codon:yes gene_type:complete
MKKKILLPFIILSLLSLKPIEKKNTDKILINNILSEIVSQDSAILNKNCKIVSGFNSPLQRPPNSFLKEINFKQTYPYFKLEDKNYYSKQIEKNKKIKLLKKNSFKEYKFISRKKVVNFIAKVESDYVKEKLYNYYDRFDKKLGKIQEFGLPLISKDGKYVFIRFYCISKRSKNRGFERIYEKNGDKWTVVKTLKEWDK